MNRRTTLKNLMVISAGVVLLPSCLQDKEKSSLSLKNIKINNDQEKLVSDLSETIIPKTMDSPGAKDISAHLFALMMMDECFAPDSQAKFAGGIREFEEFSKKKYSKFFSNCSPDEKRELLKLIENKNNIPDNVDFFYNAIKTLTIQAYSTSQYYLTKVHEYKLVPGHFYGCVPVKKAS